MIIRLKRYSYGEFETEGQLIVGNKIFATIEQPWTPNPAGHKGGKPSESCIPDGMYTVAPWKRPNGDEVFMIFNPQLGVYRLPEDHPVGNGRDLILIHKANWVTDIEGCVAPGMSRYPMKNPLTTRLEQAVAGSGNAMNKLRILLGTTQHILSITNETGASDV